MEKNNEIKRIVIIGGMGPQASIYAQKRLQQLLIENNKKAEIIHISLVIDHFFNRRPRLKLSERQISLLSAIDADIGFIACNTAHLFFEEISKLVSFDLMSIVDFDKHPELLMVCSPTSKTHRVFGDKVQHLNDELDNLSGEIISLVIEGDEDKATKKFKKLVRLLPDDQNLLVSCTELSMLASKLGIGLRCSLEESLKRIVQGV